MLPKWFRWKQKNASFSKRRYRHLKYNRTIQRVAAHPIESYSARLTQDYRRLEITLLLQVASRRDQRVPANDQREPEYNSPQRTNVAPRRLCPRKSKRQRTIEKTNGKLKHKSIQFEFNMSNLLLTVFFLGNFRLFFDCEWVTLHEEKPSQVVLVGFMSSVLRC